MKKMMSALAVAATLAGSLFSGALAAAEPEAAIKANLQEKLGLPADAITQSPVAGLYEIMTPQGLLYVSADGSKLIRGHVFDLDNGMTNLTEARMNGVRKEMLASVDGTAIEYKAADEKYVVNVFTDITCGYCRKLHNEMKDYNDAGITIRYLAFPRGGERSQAWNDMKRVWCAKDPHVAMDTAKAGSDFQGTSCEEGKVVGQHYALGNTFGVNGTPAMVLADGSIVPGYVPPARLLATLQNL